MESKSPPKRARTARSPRPSPSDAYLMEMMGRRLCDAMGRFPRNEPGAGNVEWLAAQIARSAKTVSNWRIGKHAPNAVDLFRLCELLHTHGDYLLTRSSIPSREDWNAIIEDMARKAADKRLNERLGEKG